MTDQKGRDTRSTGRLVAFVIAGAALGFLVAEELGRQGVLSMRALILVELGLAAAFLWALIVTVQIWRARNKGGPGDKR